MYDVAFVIDHSGSIRDSNVEGQPDNWERIIGFINALVDDLTIDPSGTHTAAVSYGKTSLPLDIDSIKLLQTSSEPRQ